MQHAEKADAETKTKGRGVFWLEAHTVDNYGDTAEHPNGRNDAQWMKHSLWYSQDDRLDYKPVNLQPLSVESIAPKVRSF